MADYIKIGRYVPPEQNNGTAIIDRDWTGQGFVFKDEDAFLNRPDDVCYISENSNEPYTHNDILAICDGDEDIARMVFYILDWAGPSSEETELEDEEEIIECDCCGHLFAGYDVTNCPYCGAAHEADPNNPRLYF